MPTDQNIIKEIIVTANKYGVDPNLALAVAAQESGFNPAARSPVGAQGIFQLMPATAKELGVSDPWNPTQNIDGGVKYLSQLLNKYNGNTSQALAAYNWGMGNVDRKGMTSMPEETQNYVSSILGKLGKKGVEYVTNPIKNQIIDQANQYVGANTPEGLFGSGYFTENNIPTSPQAAVKQIGSYLGAGKPQGFLGSGYLTEHELPTGFTDVAKIAGKETGIIGPQGIWNSNVARIPSMPSGYSAFGFSGLGKFPMGAAGTWTQSANPAVQNLATLGNGGLEQFGSAAASKTGTLGSTLGSIGQIAGPALGAYGMYNLINNFDNMSPTKGAGLGAMSGLGIGAAFGPVGMLVGGLLGGGLGLFAHKPKTKQEEERWRDLAKKGVVPESMVPQWVRDGVDIKAKGAGMRPDLAPDFVGYAPTAGNAIGFGNVGAGTWTNNVFGKSRNEKDLKAQDIAGYAKMYETFGPAYSRVDEDRRLAVAAKALELGLIDEHHGTIDVKSTPELMNYWNQVQGNDFKPVSSSWIVPRFPQAPSTPTPPASALAPKPIQMGAMPSVLPGPVTPMPLKPSPFGSLKPTNADWQQAMAEIAAGTKPQAPIQGKPQFYLK